MKRIGKTNAKKIRKCLDLFEYHVTHTADGDVCFCHMTHEDGHPSCLSRSLKELNKLSGLRLTVDEVLTVSDTLPDYYELSDLTRFGVAWAIGQYERRLGAL